MANIAVILALALTLSACGAATSKYTTKPVEGLPNASVKDVSLVAAKALEWMGYGITEQKPAEGYVVARKKVVEDAFGRSTEMKIQVLQGAAGAKLLGVHAFTCPGCWPMATFDPEWMTFQFYRHFDMAVRDPGRHLWMPSAKPPPGPSPLDPPPGYVPIAAPTLKITRMEIVPGKVESGSKFQLVVEFTAADPSSTEKEIPVRFRFAILAGSDVLYTSNEVGIRTGNGGSAKRTEPMTASKKKGSYSVKAYLTYKDSGAEESRAFIIQ